MGKKKKRFEATGLEKELGGRSHDPLKEKKKLYIEGGGSLDCSKEMGRRGEGRQTREERRAATLRGPAEQPKKEERCGRKGLASYLGGKKFPGRKVQ